jgi:hypothetical protein
MELQELVYFYILEESRTIEVSFRLTTDGEDEIRTDFIELSEAENFGYSIITEDLDFMSDYMDEEDEFEDDWSDIVNIDEDSLISFLNEYYVINPDKLPKAELI